MATHTRMDAIFLWKDFIIYKNKKDANDNSSDPPDEILVVPAQKWYIQYIGLHYLTSSSLLLEWLKFRIMKDPRNVRKIQELCF